MAKAWFRRNGIHNLRIAYPSDNLHAMLDIASYKFNIGKPILLTAANLCRIHIFSIEKY